MQKESSNNITNVTVTQNCGMNATCIEYRGCTDIDVRFDDGTVVQHKSKQNFLRGSIRNPNLPRNYSKILHSSCLNRTIMQNCGMDATCIAYRSARDIDVKFTDGTIVEHRGKGAFLKGGILNPNLKRKLTAYRASCIGEERMMNNGMRAVCVAYRGWADIDVQFEDGTLVQHRKKSDFLAGNIQSPDWWEKSFPQRVVFECLHEFYHSAIFNYRPKFLKNPDSGLNLELDIWIPECSIGVEYDGYPWHSSETYYSKKKYDLVLKSIEIKQIYTLIEKGCIEHSSPKHVNILVNSQHVTSNYSVLEKAINELISLLGIENKIYLDEDRLNSIREKCRNQNLGLSIIQNCGMIATCIAYRDNNDIDVQFEDGTIVKHRSKPNFLKGLIKNPVLYRKAQENNILNQTFIMRNGMHATCIGFRSSFDIDVQFEDGVIVEHVQKQHFIRGGVGHPDYHAKSIHASCVGETLRMKNGMMATCIAYRNERDLDIQFEDGTIVTNKRKGNFVRGEIDNPNYNRHSCLGASYKQSCGLNATCIAYRGCYDIDVQFEDGVIVQNKMKQAFILGNIAHPNHNTRKQNASCLGVTVRMSNGMNATCIEYRAHNDIDVQFEDGYIAHHRRKERFLKGEIAHKNFGNKDE